MASLLYLNRDIKVCSRICKLSHLKLRNANEKTVSHMQDNIDDPQQISNTIFDDPDLQDPDAADATDNSEAEMQSRMVASIVSNAELLEYASTILKPAMLGSWSMRHVLDVALQFHHDNGGGSPSPDMLQVLLKRNLRDMKDITTHLAEARKLHYLESNASPEFWKAEIAKLVEMSLVKNAFDHLKNRDFSKLYEATDKARQLSASLKPQAKLLGMDDAENQPPIVWQVQGHFPVKGCVTIFGPSGAGKSFYCLDMAFSIAYGLPFMGFDVKQGKVLYICSEGSYGLGGRIRAWREKHDIRNVSPDISFSDTSHNVQDTAAMDVLVKMATDKMGGLDIVFIDTLSRNFGEGDTSDNKAMMDYVKGVDHIRETTGATVVSVHHTGWSDANRERGAKSLRDASDSSILVDQHSQDLIEISCKKVKDGAEFSAYMVRKIPVAAAESLYLKLEGNAKEVKNSEQVYGNSDEDDKQALKITKVITAIPAISMVDTPDDQNTTTSKEIAKATGMSDTTVNRIVAELVESGVVCRSQGSRRKAARIWQHTEFALPASQESTLV